MIIVTGGNQGIGKAICERLTKQGEEVVSISRGPTELRLEHFQCDVSDAAALREIALQLKRDKREISGLINAAGIASMNLLVMTPPETVERVIDTNLLGTIYSCQSFVPMMIRSKSGVVINFSTIAVALSLQGEAVYAASKAGVESFSHTFAREVSSFGIRVNCIAPGPIDTNLLRGVSRNKIEEIISSQVIRRQFSTSDVCDVVEVLLDKKFQSISGQVLSIGGN